MRFSDRSSDVARPIPVLQPDLADVGLPLTPGTLVKRAVLIEKPFGKGAPVMWVGGDHPITLRGNRCGAQKGEQQKQQAQTVQLYAGVEIGRAPCRERVYRYVYIPEVPDQYKKKRQIRE